MHYHSWHTSDYFAHTQHLDLLEDLAYRRMLDYCYLHEIPLPEDVKDIARLIRMRGHEEEISLILREFFTLSEQGWTNKRVLKEIQAYQDKAEKASRAGKASAKARTRMNTDLPSNGRSTDVQQTFNTDSTDVQPTNNHEPITINHKPRTKFIKPSLEDVKEYAKEIGFSVNPEHFIDYYEARGWKMSGNQPVRDWKACLRTWKRNQKQTSSSDITVPEVII